MPSVRCLLPMLFVLAGGLSLSARASAALPPSTPKPSPESSSHVDHPATIFAIRGMVCLHCVPLAAAPVPGVGIFVERAVLDHHLAVELAASRLKRGEVSEVPIEALVKVPVRWRDTVELSPGVGGVVARPSLEQHWVAGVVANVDVFFWNRHNLALLVEADGVVHPGPEPLAVLELATGVAHRF